MTLDEAITHAKEVAASKCDECGEEHRLLAEWLQELKMIRTREDTRTLTPEILTAAGWKEEKNDFFHFAFSKDIDDEKFDRTADFNAYMVVDFRKVPKNKNYVKFDVERTLGDSFHIDFKRNITVGEFNTLLNIVKLNKFKLNEKSDIDSIVR